MFSTEDTIVAIATPPGKGGLGVVRISGSASPQIATEILEVRTPLRARYATLTRVRGASGVVDAVVATLFAEPQSYTGEHVVEISAHGSVVVLRAIVDAAIRAGARLARPGEFTLRAFLNGKLDLVQSEAVADLVDAATPLQARTAFDQLDGTLTARIGGIEQALFELIARVEASLDFPDEGYHFIDPAELREKIGTLRCTVDELRKDARRGKLLREGAQVVLAGKTNAGKSSIFNKLTGHDRVIVAATPGTTRDLVSEQVDIGGVPVTLVDTAGIRDASDQVERAGIARTEGAVGVADVVLVVMDQSRPLDDDDRRTLRATEGNIRVVVMNKSDLPRAWGSEALAIQNPQEVSAHTGEGMDALRRALAAALGAGPDLRDTPAVSNVRHAALLDTAAASLGRAERALEDRAVPEEFVLADLQHARAALEEVTGKRSTEELLQHIFERFCIGK